MPKLSDLADLSPGWERLVSDIPALRGFLDRRASSRAIEVFPDILSDDPRVLALTEWLVTQLSTPEWEPAVTEQGLSANGLAGGYDKLLTVAGYRATPVPVGQSSNVGLRATLELPSDWVNPDDAQLAREVYRRVFGAGRASSAPIKKSSSAGISAVAPMTKDVLAKKQMYLDGVHILIKNSSRTFTGPEFIARGIYPLALSVFRSQADGVEKQRTAEIGDGVRAKVDKTITHVQGHYASRIRLAFGASGTANYPLTCLLSCVRKHYYATYGDMYKHRGPEEVSAKLKRATRVFSIDVTNFDTTVPSFFFEAFRDALTPYWTPAYLSLTMALFAAPVLSNAPYSYEDMMAKKLTWPSVGDPFDSSTYTLTRGLLSGVAINPDFGKATMTAELVIRLHSLRHKYPSLDMLADNCYNLDRFMTFKHPLIVCCNATDDNLIGVTVDALVDDFFSTKGYFQVDRERYPAFLGSIYCGQPGALYGLPNISSFLERVLVPEHGIGHTAKDRRAFWYTGWVARKMIYSKHPRFAEMYTMLDEGCRKMFGVSVESLMKVRNEPETLLTYTGADLTYLLDPDSIHYKIDPSDVTPELLGVDIASIPEHINTTLAKHLTLPAFSWS